jgi:hypothetical protein
VVWFFGFFGFLSATLVGALVLLFAFALAALMLCVVCLGLRWHPRYGV